MGLPELFFLAGFSGLLSTTSTAETARTAGLDLPGAGVDNTKARLVGDDEAAETRRLLADLDAKPPFRILGLETEVQELKDTLGFKTRDRLFAVGEVSTDDLDCLLRGDLEVSSREASCLQMVLTAGDSRLPVFMDFFLFRQCVTALQIACANFLQSSEVSFGKAF